MSNPENTVEPVNVSPYLKQLKRSQLVAARDAFKRRLDEDVCRWNMLAQLWRGENP